jgi:hypothetical protein
MQMHCAFSPFHSGAIRKTKFVSQNAGKRVMFTGSPVQIRVSLSRALQLLRSDLSHGFHQNVVILRPVRESLHVEPRFQLSPTGLLYAENRAVCANIGAVFQ